MESQSRVASAAIGLGFAGAGASVLGPVGAKLGALSPMLGFSLLGIGLLCGLLAVIVGLVGLWSTRPSSGRSGRGRAIAGLGIGLLLVFAVGAMRGDADSRADFNDVTTDLADPPAFSHAQSLGPNEGRDLGYPAEFEPKQRELYPDIAPIAVSASPADAYANAESAANSLGWEITWSDGTARIEATDTSAIFRFVDDIAIRIRPSGAGSTIDVRSKSRDGRGDLGVNAARIRAFKDALGS